MIVAKYNSCITCTAFIMFGCENILIYHVVITLIEHFGVLLLLLWSGFYIFTNCTFFCLPYIYTAGINMLLWNS